MEQHESSWFDILLGNLYTNTERFIQHVAGDPPSEELQAHGVAGVTWLAHEPVSAQHVFSAALVVTILCLLGVRVSRAVRDVKLAMIPEETLTVRTFTELLVGGVYEMMVGMMGKKAAKFFLPLIGSLAFFIFFSNVLGLTPHFLPPTDKVSTTLALGLIVFFATHIFGVREHGAAYFKHFLGPFLPLAPLMLVIELVSHIVRPLSLAIRLAANMTADHMVLLIFIGLVPFVVPIPMYVMGCIVVTVQTLVFCLLSTVYISLAIAHEDH
ncbi:MAG: F0F1 ATP synthase subunit A [Myxococcota bacterium]